MTALKGVIAKMWCSRVTARRTIALAAATAIGVGGAQLLAGTSSVLAQTPPNLPILQSGAVRTLVLANSNGQVYKTVQPNGDVCLTTVTPDGTSATTCADAATAATQGVMQVQVVSDGQYAPGITVLAPVDVTAVTFVMRNGNSDDVAVANGVAQVFDADLSAATYASSSGGQVSVTVPTAPPSASP